MNSEARPTTAALPSGVSTGIILLLVWLAGTTFGRTILGLILGSQRSQTAETVLGLSTIILAVGSVSCFVIGVHKVSRAAEKPAAAVVRKFAAYFVASFIVLLVIAFSPLPQGAWTPFLPAFLGASKALEAWAIVLLVRMMLTLVDTEGHWLASTADLAVKSVIAAAVVGVAASLLDVSISREWAASKVELRDSIESFEPILRIIARTLLGLVLVMCLQRSRTKTTTQENKDDSLLLTRPKD